MPAEKEKPESTEKAASAPPAVDTVSAPPGKVAGPQPLARAADTLGAAQQGGAPGRARMAGSMQQNVGNSRVGRMLSGDVQRKPEDKSPSVSAPEDREEKEADNMSEEVMRMSDEDARAASPVPAPESAGVSGSGGQPLSKSDREFMEPRFGRSFENVKLHTDNQAQKEATGIGAKAFTKGSDISFGPGSGPDDKKLLAHELTHVAQQDAGNGSEKSVMRAPGPLTPAKEASAVNFTTNHYDERSVRIIQLITGATVNGIFNDVSAQAVATWQSPRGLVVDGKVGVNSLNQMVADRVAANRREDAIQIVVDFHNLNVTSNTLAVRFDPTLGVVNAATTFESGNLRVIRLGPPAFSSEPTLRTTIIAQLAIKPPAVPPIGPRPTLLTVPQEKAAILDNKSRFTDPRAVRAIQGHVGTNPDAIFGPDTVERIADAQRIAGLPVDGKVDLGTVERFVMRLIATGNPNAAIRVIMDFFDFSEANLLSIFFDPTVPSNARTAVRPNEPASVRMGPTGMAQPFASLVHTIAHELEHVRQNRVGLTNVDTGEFLGEAVEVLSDGMPEEPLESVAPGAVGFTPGFADDARRALFFWNRMPAAERQTNRLRFIAVRDRVRARIAAGTPAQQTLHATLLANYNAVVVPAP